MTFLTTDCFSFHNTATAEIYTLSLHDALPIFCSLGAGWARQERRPLARGERGRSENLDPEIDARSEEHTSELQSRRDLVSRLLLENINTTLLIDRTGVMSYMTNDQIVNLPTEH